MLEVGVFEGRTTLWFHENILTSYRSSHWAVDTFEGGEDQREAGVDCTNLLEKFNENIKPYRHHEMICVGKSKDILPRIVYHYFDIIYIDGSHVADDTYNDICLSWPLLQPLGVLMMDDYEWTGDPSVERRPKVAIDRWLSENDGKYRLLHKGSIVIVERNL
jgi:hypothetical protein